MRSELRLAEHSLRPGERVVEIWYGGEFIAQVTAADGPGVRIISKSSLMASGDSFGMVPNVITVEVSR